MRAIDSRPLDDEDEENAARRSCLSAALITGLQEREGERGRRGEGEFVKTGLSSRPRSRSWFPGSGFGVSGFEAALTYVS